MTKRKILIGAAVAVCLLYALIYLSIKFVPLREKAKIAEEREEAVSIETKEEKAQQKEFQSIPKITKETAVLSRRTPDANKEIKALIENLESENFQTRQGAADELVSLGKEAVFGLLEKLPQASVGLKGQIVFILGRIKDKDATPALMEILELDENAYIRRNAAEALGKIKDERALLTLINGLFDDDDSVRERSAWALGDLKDTYAVKDLADRINYEKEERVKSAIVDSLGKIKDQRATLTLVEELKSKNDQLYKNKVVVALGEIADSRALPELTEYVNVLKQYKPTEKILIFQWEESIKIAEEAIGKIQGKQ